MNTYHLTKCPHCGTVIVKPYDGGSNEEDDFTVHGAGNLIKARKMLENGMSVPEVAHKFCGYCGNEIPCSCSSPRPQLVYR